MSFKLRLLQDSIPSRHEVALLGKEGALYNTKLSVLRLEMEQCGCQFPGGADIIAISITICGAIVLLK